MGAEQSKPHIEPVIESNDANEGLAEVLRRIQEKYPELFREDQGTQEQGNNGQLELPLPDCLKE